MILEAASLQVRPGQSGAFESAFWDSVAAHEEGFRKSPQYQQWKRLLHHFYDPFPIVLHYEQMENGPVQP
jgi:hypothetical protein